MCGIWSDSDDHLTNDPRTFLYSILYSKKAAVEAYTPPTHSLSRGPMSIQQLYSSYTGCLAIQLYSSSTVYILYSIPLPCSLVRPRPTSSDLLNLRNDPLSSLKEFLLSKNTLRWCALERIGLQSSAFACGRLHWSAVVCVTGSNLVCRCVSTGRPGGGGRMG